MGHVDGVARLNSIGVVCVAFYNLRFLSCFSCAISMFCHVHVLFFLGGGLVSLEVKWGENECFRRVIAAGPSCTSCSHR